MVYVKRTVAEEIEISLNCEFENIGIEIQISGFLIFIFAISVAVPQLGITTGNPESDIISKLLAEEKSNRWFWCI